MSLEDRCTKFHEAALGTGKSKGAATEIATLRRFLHRNQDQRFTDKAKTRLLECICIYAKHENGEGLLEDALKMPFSVFGKEKKKMIKLLEEIRGRNGGNSIQSGSSTTTERVLSLVDLEEEEGEGSMTLMDDATGESFENVPLPPDKTLQQRLKDAFASTFETIDVKVVVSNGHVSVVGF